MLEQIRRLNEEQARIHEQRRVQAINKIKQMRLQQKEQHGRTTIPQ
jgi:predicted transposase YbfD/YdcC